jgi:hypothetical protein
VDLDLQDRVEQGQFVADMHNIFDDVVASLRSPITGIVIGLTTNPLVNRGKALLHVAAISPEAQVCAPTGDSTHRGTPNVALAQRHEPHAVLATGSIRDAQSIPVCPAQ